jgi:hypothetical protein
MVERGDGHLVAGGGALGVSLCLRLDPRRRLAALAVTNRPLSLDHLAGHLLGASLSTKERNA